VKKIAPWALGGLAVLGVFAGFRQCGGARSTAVSASAPPAELVAGAPTPAGDLAVRPMSTPLSGSAASLGLAPGPAADLATILGSNETSVPQKVVLEETRFITNRSTLSDEVSAEIGDISRVLKAFPHARIAVVGHTDSSGTELHNSSLSEDRAISVRDALVSHGVAADHLPHIVERIRVIRHTHRPRGGQVEIFRVQRQFGLRVDVEALADHRRHHGIAAGLAAVKIYVVNLLSPRNALRTRLERKINRLQKWQHCRAFFEFDAGKISRLDPDVRNRYHLRTCQ